ncbi:MAG: PD-(D/E)XK nuclease family protein [Desulfovibrio sp.]|nr:PD-(D/E)XK nuclease family protein [Desulfovibrio sp.]
MYVIEEKTSIMPASPFVLFSWRRSFLADLTSFIHNETNGHPERALLVIPSTRPWRYLVDEYRSRHHVGLLPKVVTLEDCLRAWLQANAIPVRPYATSLDTISILFDIVSSCSADEPFLQSHFASPDLARFWPVGRRLAGLLDEIYRQGKTPRDIHLPDAEEARSFIPLLASLGRIHHDYQRTLSEQNLSTKAIDLYLAAVRGEKTPPALSPSEERRLIIAGFSVLDGAEEILLRRLWEQGAVMALHTDQALIGTGPCHHAALPHRTWMSRWHAEGVCFEGDSPEGPRPALHFFAGYDSHSELAALNRDIARRTGKKESQAVILLDPGLLMPVLHSLPEKDVNISLGYPFLRTPLGQLLHELLVLLEHREDTEYRTSDIVHLLHHPYIWRVLENAEENGQNPQRSAVDLASFDETLLSGKRTLSIGELLSVYPGSAEQKEILGALCTLLFDRIGNANCLEDLADALEELLEKLCGDADETMISRPLDRESFAVLQASVLPSLAENAMSGKPVSRALLRTILNDMLSEERIPFEADPLTGIQILGLSETQLLHFDHVYILDATDDLLPGGNAPDVFLPDELRLLLGMPNQETRSQKNEYNIFRLIEGSGLASFYWQEGLEKGGTGRKVRSRFVEQLIWEAEQELGRVLGPNDEPLESARAVLTQSRDERVALRKTDAMAKKLHTVLEKPLSATLLDGYLSCPARFARERILELKTVDETSERDLPLRIGSAVHSILERLIGPFLGREMSANCVTKEMIDQEVEKSLASDELRGIHPLTYYILRVSMKNLLGRYFETIPKSTALALEAKIRRRFWRAGENEYTLFGIVDRIDKRNDEIVILDYKTGAPHLPKKELWSDENLFTEIEAVLSKEKPVEKASALLDEIRPLLPSIQLPLYMVLTEEFCREKFKNPAANAALVNLAKDGKELPLFSGKDPVPPEERLRYCRDILALLIYCLEKNPSFEPIVGDSCKFCAYADLCLVTR